MIVRASCFLFLLYLIDVSESVNTPTFPRRSSSIVAPISTFIKKRSAEPFVLLDEYGHPKGLPTSPIHSTLISEARTKRQINPARVGGARAFVHRVNKGQRAVRSSNGNTAEVKRFVRQNNPVVIGGTRAKRDTRRPVVIGGTRAKRWTPPQYLQPTFL